MKFNIKQVIGVIKVLILVSFTCSLGAITLLLFWMSSLLVKPFSLGLYRRIVTAISSLTFNIATFITQRWSRMIILLKGDAYPQESSSLVILNHSSRTDWLITVAWLTLGYPYPGNVKFVAMDSISRIPIFGWILRMAEFVFLAQKWDVDKERFITNLTSLSLYEDQTGNPLCIVLFPEGTLNEPHHIVKSKQYAGKTNQPVFEHVLLPRFRGFREMLPILREKVDYVVDTTCIFSPNKPDIFQVLAGQATETALFITKTYPINDIPTEDAQVDEWLLDRWREKEGLFEKHRTSDMVDSMNEDEKNYLMTRHVYLKMFIVFSMFVIPFSVLIYDISLIKHGLTYLLFACCMVSAATLASFMMTIAPDTNKKDKKKKDYGSTEPIAAPVEEASEKEVVLEIE